MQHDVLLGRDSWMRFQDRSYCAIAPCPLTSRVLDSSAHPESFHLLYAGDTDIMLSRDYRLLDVDLVRSNGAPALDGCYLVSMLHAATNFSAE